MRRRGDIRHRVEHGADLFGASDDVFPRSGPATAVSSTQGSGEILWEATIMAGLGDKVEGKAKEIKGKVTDDKSTEMEGKAQQAAGKIKDTADDVADEMRDRTHAKTHR
jgi:uncharacterized protein YjbJ (UPF0337 family)